MFSSLFESCESCVVCGGSVLCCLDPPKVYCTVVLGERLVLLSWIWGPFGVPVGLIVVAAAAVGGVENDDVVVATLSIESLDEVTVALCTSLSLEAPLVSSVSMGCVLEDGLRWKKFPLALFFSVAMGSGFLIG